MLLSILNMFHFFLLLNLKINLSEAFMKKYFLYELMKMLKQKPETMKKLKILIVVGLASVVIIGGLLVWGTVTAVNYVATQAEQTLSTQTAQEQITKLKSTAESLPTLNTLSCWQKAESLMNLQPWLANTVVNNLLQLKSACFGEISQNCEETTCT